MTNLKDGFKDYPSIANAELQETESWISKNWHSITFILLGVILAVLFLYLQQCHHKTNNFNDKGLDSIKVWKDKYNQEHAKTEVYESDNVGIFLAMKTKDSSILYLQGKVKEYQNKLKEVGSSVTIVSNNTNINESFKDSIVRIEGKDTNISSVFINNDPKDINENELPTYGFQVHNKWLNGGGYSNKDSTHLDLKVHNEYSVIVGYESQGLFKPKKPFAEITNSNPYTETDKIRSYQVQAPKPKRFGIGFNVGYGVYFDPSRVRLGSGITGSVGFSYNLINIK